MGKSAPVPAPPPFSPIDPLKDAFLFAGDFKILFYICLVGFCLANARVVLGATPKINYFHGCAMMVLICFGGSTISAAMVGAPFARLLANLVVMGGGVLGRAFVEAYKQALQSARWQPSP